MDFVIKDYLVWNLKACESMLGSKDDEAFAKIQKNITEYKSYIATFGFRRRALLNAAMTSWKRYEMLGRINWNLKRIYVAIKNL